MSGNLLYKLLVIKYGDTKGMIRRLTDSTLANRKMDQQTNNDIQNTSPEAKDWATRTPQTKLRCSGRVKFKHRWIQS